VHGHAIKVLRSSFAQNDRALADGETGGMVKVIATRRGRVLGVSIAGTGAGELIQPWVMAIAGGIKLSRMMSYIHPYPTRGEASKRAALSHFAGFASNPLVRGVIKLVSIIRP
jgi:pyruvate/2-oxoglutarate dehydrogenase complex dihydrolipoamide dehydrogenase (E3) component